VRSHSFRDRRTEQQRLIEESALERQIMVRKILVAVYQGVSAAGQAKVGNNVLTVSSPCLFAVSVQSVEDWYRQVSFLEGVFEGG
jgi:hypothetical protein